jgi:hypothetical protein
VPTAAWSKRWCRYTMPAGRTDDPRRQIQDPLQRGSHRRGAQRGARPPESGGHHAPVRRHAPPRGASIVRRAAQELPRFLSRERRRGSSPPRHDKAWLSIAILGAMVLAAATASCPC